jgi:hypothetical protein
VENSGSYYFQIDLHISMEKKNDKNKLRAETVMISALTTFSTS